MAKGTDARTEEISDNDNGEFAVIRAKNCPVTVKRSVAKKSVAEAMAANWPGRTKQGIDKRGPLTGPDGEDFVKVRTMDLPWENGTAPRQPTAQEIKANGRGHKAPAAKQIDDWPGVCLACGGKIYVGANVVEHEIGYCPARTSPPASAKIQSKGSILGPGFLKSKP